ncbi:hypothetical protein V2J09_007938 [Rumex salicifolius]
METISPKLLVLMLVIIFQLLLIPQSCYSSATGTATMAVEEVGSAPEFDRDALALALALAQKQAMGQGRRRRKEGPSKCTAFAAIKSPSSLQMVSPCTALAGTSSPTVTSAADSTTSLESKI